MAYEVAEPLADPATWAVPTPLTKRWARLLKRCEDLAVGVPLLVLTLPVQGVVAVLVKATSRGPVFFSQQRVGRDGRPVEVVKFRSMCVDAEDRLRSDPELFEEYVANGFKLRADRDHRITRVGKWLRKTSLDELPQLWAVVAGDLSIVGPRPVLEEELAQYYGDRSGWYLVAKPGLTGLWQVSGRSLIGFDERVPLDVDYVERWSLRRDIGILCRTVPAVLSARGAH